MTSKLKCPVCQNELRQLFNRYTGEQNLDYECGNFDCDLYGIEIPESVWKAVIQKLEDLKIAREALEDIVEGKTTEISWDCWDVATKALKQIDHKE